MAILAEWVNVIGCLACGSQENSKKELWYYFIKKIKDFLGIEANPGGGWSPLW
jgi:hypothetical protein